MFNRARLARLGNDGQRRRRRQKRFTKVEKEAIRQIFLFQNISDYTKTLKREDFDCSGLGLIPKKLLPKSFSEDTESTEDSESGLKNADDGRFVDVELGTVHTESGKDNIHCTDEVGNDNQSEGSACAGVVPVIYKSDSTISLSDARVSVPLPGMRINLVAGQSTKHDSSCDKNDAVPTDTKSTAQDSPSIVETSQQRKVPNSCAICLCDFDVGSRVTWSSNESCPHVFHEDCILSWLLALGRKTSQRNNDSEDSSEETEKDVVDFPMPCPCCRQEFVLHPGDVVDGSTGTDDVEELDV